MINYFKITNIIGNLFRKGDSQRYDYLKDIPIRDLPPFLIQCGYRYDPDRKYFDYMQKPEVTIARKAGDCDDYARLYCDIARHQGYEAAVYADWDNKHAICSVLFPGYDIPVCFSNFTVYPTTQEYLNSRKNKNVNLQKIY